jgi:asparagine synthetase B (glutamine-hydrolysing)
MFAFALYDAEKDLIFLARDRCGIKPLHYIMLNDGTFLFASEIKSLLQYKRVKPQMDPESLHQIINHRYIPGEHTKFSGNQTAAPCGVFHGRKRADDNREVWDPSMPFQAPGRVLTSKNFAGFSMRP